MPDNATTDLAIRLQRAAFNRALAAGDLGAISDILHPNAVLVTGTDSAVLNGRKAQLLAWKREFAAAPGARVTYTRTSEAVTASPVEPIAMERGAWQGVNAAGAVLARGSYAAKWRNVAPAAPQPQWVIVAEIFVTLG